MKFNSDKPQIDESLLLDEETQALPENVEQDDSFNFYAAAEELNDLGEKLFQRADKVNSPKLANALEVKADKLTTESMKFRGWAAELPGNLSLDSAQAMLIKLRAEAQELLSERDAKPSSLEILLSLILIKSGPLKKLTDGGQRLIMSLSLREHQSLWSLLRLLFLWENQFTWTNQRSWRLLQVRYVHSVRRRSPEKRLMSAKEKGMRAS